MRKFALNGTAILEAQLPRAGKPAGPAFQSEEAVKGEKQRSSRKAAKGFRQAQREEFCVTGVTAMLHDVFGSMET